MRKINEILKKYDLRPFRYKKNGKITFIDTGEGKYAVKEKKSNNIDIFKYLNTRSFNYYPEIISDLDDEYEVTRYVEDTPVPNEQKMLDMVDLASLLHNKTTHYKEVDEDDYKRIYEDIMNNIEYLNSYYTDIITVIESKVYMSPSEYLFARNISKIYGALKFCSTETEKWYNLIKDKRKWRQVVIHNNLNLDHFIRNSNSYLVSWDKARIDIPIFDIYKLYKKHGLEYDFSDILNHYEKYYPLKEDERKLLFILIVLPDKIDFDDTEYNLCKKISEFIDYIYKTEVLVSPYYSKKEPHNPQT